MTTKEEIAQSEQFLHLSPCFQLCSIIVLSFKESFQFYSGMFSKSSSADLLYVGNWSTAEKHYSIYQTAARYEWFQWSTQEFIFEEHPYIFVSSSGYLYFSEVQPTDERKYFCVVTVSAPMRYTFAVSQPPSRTSLGVWLLVTGTGRGF